jgi:hypothetical protein
MSGLAESKHRTDPLTAARLGGYWLIVAEPPRQFPAPWRADKVPGGYVVRDTTGQAGQALVYLYGRETEADARQAKVLTNDEARRIAINVARLPELLGKADRD